jgi:hypothetical protein
VTAGALVVLSLGLMVTRCQVLGEEIKGPAGPSNWKVVLLVNGISQGHARVDTPAPLDVGRQHVVSEEYASTQLNHRVGSDKEPGRRLVHWSSRASDPDGPFRLRCDYHITLDVARPSAGMARVAHSLAAPPKQGEYLDRESQADTDHEQITARARQLTQGLTNPTDIAQALYRHIDQDILNEPSVSGPTVSAAGCLKEGGGDCAAKGRLLVALLRNRGIPARLVSGVLLNKTAEQRAQYVVEAWVRERWLPMCPSLHHFGKALSSFLVLGYGEQPLVRGRQVRDLDHAFLVEHIANQREDAGGLKSFFRAVSLFVLPPAEQRLVEFLLLLPVAALIICLFRNLIGMTSFGVFAPALVGLAFRDLRSWPGILVFVSILLVGWLMRRVLDSYHLLQVPRVALMLSLIVLVLVLSVLLASYYDFPATRYIALFPMIILTGMVERFWTLEAEDGVTSSFKTLLSTLAIAGTISLVLSFKVLARWLFVFPETLGLIMAAQLLIGRYTGYRLMELLRFRDFLTTPPGGPLSGLRLVVPEA